MARWEMEPKDPPRLVPLERRAWPEALTHDAYGPRSAEERWRHREYAPVPQLGDLCKPYESGNRGPGTVSHGNTNGDPGGVSYGTYQLSSVTGSARAFVGWLDGNHPDYALVFQGLQPGTAAFDDAWRGLAAIDGEGFDRAQHDYIHASHYEPARAAIEGRIPGLMFDDRSGTLRDVLWSTAVQHGPGGVRDDGRTTGAVDVFADALAGRDVANMTDAEIISAVYGERGRHNAEGNLARFPSVDEAWKAGLEARFVAEERDALASLDREQQTEEYLRAQERAQAD
jgi:hypothetical protein